MPLTHYFLRNRRFSLVVFVFLLAVGYRALKTIPLAEDPALEIPRFDVLAIVPGSDPSDMEKLVVRPLEDALKELEDVKRVTATMRDSVAHLSVEFQFNTDTDKKYDDVLRQVNATKPRLPSTINRLEVLRGRTTNVAIMQIALTVKPDDESQLLDRGHDLVKKIENIPGIKNAELHAAPEKEARVSLKVAELDKYHLPLQQVLAIIQTSNVVIPGGTLDDDNKRINVRTGDAITSIDQLRELPLGPNPVTNTVIRLKDVADVSWRFDGREVKGRYNGAPAVFVTAMMQKNGDISAVSHDLHTAVDAFRIGLPAGMNVEIGFDQAANVSRRIDHLRHDFLLALVLVLLTLAPLGFRSSIIVIISIPLCLAMTLAALQWCDFSLNQLSIVGCVIALGLLVDDSIVVIENITRFHRDGHAPMEAARLATKQISVAVIGTTATLLFAFLPLVMLPEAAGLFIRSLPAAVIFAVLASLFVALSIVPWLASLLLKPRTHSDGNAVLRILHRAIAGFYRPILAWCMRHRVTTLVLAAAITAASFSLVPSIGFSLFPKADTPQFLIQISADENATLATTDDLAKQVETLLRDEAAVKSVFTTVGAGNPRVYYNVFPADQKASIANVFATLESYDNKKTPALMARLREKVSHINGARIDVKEFENGPPISAPIEVRIIGEDLDKLTEAAAQFEAAIKDVPGVRNVNNPLRTRRPDVVTRMKEDELAAVGVGRLAARQFIRLAFAGLDAGTIRNDDGSECSIRLTLHPKSGATQKNWDDGVVCTATGKYLPLKQFGSLEPSSAPALIERRNRERLVTLSATLDDGINADRATHSVREKLDGLKLPSGFRYEFGGEAESRAESFAGFGNAILLAIFGILAILVIEFRTFRGTLIVASVIPLGIIGGLIGLRLTGYSLSFMAVIGFIALIGIEIKNSILLVDFTNQLRARGVGLDAAIAQAGEIRFLPVVLTTLTALGALLPLALQRSQLYSPLAVVIIGGSLSSLLLSRLVTPVLYRLFPPHAATNAI